MFSRKYPDIFQERWGCFLFEYHVTKKIICTFAVFSNLCRFEDRWENDILGEGVYWRLVLTHQNLTNFGLQSKHGNGRCLRDLYRYASCVVWAHEGI